MRTTPAIIFTSITPSDSTVLGDVRSIFIGGAGTIALEDRNGDSTTFTVQDGQILPCQPVRVLLTGTTATGIIGLV